MFTGGYSDASPWRPISHFPVTRAAALIGASKRKETGVFWCASTVIIILISSPLEQIESGRPAERNEDKEPWTATHAREHPLGCAQQIANCKDTPFLIEIFLL